ncbi:MAG: alcohol dehydrogenase, partial [Candidatus Fimenecus sp.]
MWALKTAYYRAFQQIMKIFMIFLDWSEPELLTGPGSIKKLPGVIADKGINNVMIVTDKGLMSLHILDGL